MLQSIGDTSLMKIVILHFVIVVSGAFILQTNSYLLNDDRSQTKEYDQSSESSLSFLDGFIVEDDLQSLLQGESNVHKRRITKRNALSASVPQYMFDVYELLSDRKHHVVFDTARSFHSTKQDKMSTSIPDDLKMNGYTFYPLIFNVSHFPHSESALLAQVRIQLNNPEILNDFGLRNIQLYSWKENSLILLANKHLNPSKRSLLTINVTEAFRNAIASNKKEIRFQISVPDEILDLMTLTSETVNGPQLLVLSKSSSNIERSEDVILNRMRRSLEQNFTNLSSKKSNVNDVYDHSTMKVFNQTEATADSLAITNKRRSRKRRSEEDDEEAEEQSNYIVEELGRIRKGKLKRKKNPCRRKPLHVSFAAINYDQWIIAPPTYEAFECTGRCSFPMSAHLAPTKHAIIQTLMHSLEPKQVSRACCVPIKLSPMSILYVEDDGTVTYKYDYEDMVVAECGCR
ncbi:hypothetical protein JTE90_008979 [Oedothorax gibbosus]|uniref:TGF-beta family profile domain-containing protein n=1 Tax=Oedothorax gibbosus TaxID=931172 RepID=A0AAV6UJ63_9ARAC|nr:hypothetical protein JTE90_008979 [Oedothorax gibbosus]